MIIFRKKTVEKSSNNAYTSNSMLKTFTIIDFKIIADDNKPKKERLVFEYFHT